ncbi:hypothetical protein OAP56_04140 [Rickettsiaceae bacterium]|nr:hypothetical protein [Rickettsiaceae bacterium]
MNKKKLIPNPNKISVLETNFIDEKTTEKNLQEQKINRYKGRMISMSDEFYGELNEFLQNNPTDGNRSSFVVRIVAEYIKIKKDR